MMSWVLLKAKVRNNIPLSDTVGEVDGVNCNVRIKTVIQSALY